MRVPLRCGLLLAGLFVVAAGASAQTKPTGGNATDDDYKKLATTRELTCKLIACDGQSVRFRVEIQVPQMTSPPRPTRAGQRPRPPQVRVATQYKDFELPLTADAKLRTQLLMKRIDENGKEKPYTAAEKAELKGKENLPGYTTTAEDLRNGHVVKLTLVRPKGNVNEKDKSLDEIKPTVSMIMVLQDGPEVPGTVMKKKK
jgi:hypothetical protein